VLPALFPFAVLSELLIGGGISELLSPLLRRPLSLPPLRWLGFSPDGACAMLLGLLCGFPIGTRALLSLRRQGRITHRECQRLLFLSVNPSLAFLSGTVGASFFGDRRLGLLLYLSSLSAALLLCLFPFPNQKGELPPPTFTVRSAPPSARVFTAAIRSAASSMATVCAFVVFFSVLTGCLSSLLSALPTVVLSLLLSVVELTAGTASSAEIGGTCGLLLCGFSVGWSGLSMHLQMMSISAEFPYSMARFFLFKLLQGVLCACFLFIFSALGGI
jgi:hypothetical protein